MKILALGFYIPGTGFTRVLDEIFSRISVHHEVHLIGIGYKGPIKNDKFILYPNNLNGGDIYGAYNCKELAEKINPDCIFILNDFWQLKNYRRALKSYQDGGGRVIAYAPLDGEIVDESILRQIDFLDALVVYNQTSKKQVALAKNRIQHKDKNYQFPEVHVIAHGTNISHFNRIGISESTFSLDRSKIKPKVFPGIPNAADAFIVLNANRYVNRKRIDLTIKGFGAFAKGKDNVWLYLHHAIATPDEKEEIQHLATEANCENRIILNNRISERKYISDESLNELYCACDVGVNTTMGEGWGMVAFEHAATGAAQILPEDFTGRELWKDNALYLKNRRKFIPNWSPFNMSEVDDSSLTQILNQLYQDEKLLSEYSLRAYKNARSKEFDWGILAEQWNSLFNGIYLNSGQRIRSRSIIS